MERETITLTPKDTYRIAVLAEVDRGSLTAKEAATRLNLSLRQVRRLLRAWRQHGVAAMVHGNKGRQPSHALSQETKNRVCDLLSSAYCNLNHQHASDLLGERDHIRASRTTVRRLRANLGLKTPRKRRPRAFRSRRERMIQAGTLVQIDGSQHKWFGEHLPPACLLSAVDDATGAILAAVFRPTEDLVGYYELLKCIVQSHGIPLAVYSDRHSIHFSAKGAVAATIHEQLDGQIRLTQFGRCLSELGVQQIPANSPQAKGRIERLFGTLQDRLLKEMRLDNIERIDQANDYLAGFIARYNGRFAVAPTISEHCFRPAPTNLDYSYVFASQHGRVVQNDNTVSFAGRIIQIHEGPTKRTYAKARVTVCQAIDGLIRVYYGPDPIAGPFNYAELPHKATCRSPVQATPPQPARPPVPRRPAADHPWRRNQYPLKTSAYANRKGH